ncbi:hypothetical protein R3W88_013492 [Solanum pinnatisectum]|uniref:F-box associated beta-propeller type 3 domain-containing protein n=1 Tax=Solanum pinnatisectum TaxID=50273 RepID=A0AAV9KPB0_9SOLN|nr:hypothetical protein R3W88_013492 [Solanum pinnatisectum]
MDIKSSCCEGRRVSHVTEIMDLPWVIMTHSGDPKFHFPLGRLFFVGLCNGFICLLNGSTYIEKHFISISNLLSGEYFEVKLPVWEISVCHVAYRFCFSKASREYKVLRLGVRKVSKVSEYEVYTLGVGEKCW